MTKREKDAPRKRPLLGLTILVVGSAFLWAVIIYAAWSIAYAVGPAVVAFLSGAK